jgi:hypothetical protein
MVDDFLGPACAALTSGVWMLSILPQLFLGGTSTGMHSPDIGAPLIVSLTLTPP